MVSSSRHSEKYLIAGLLGGMLALGGLHAGTAIRPASGGPPSKTPPLVLTTPSFPTKDLLAVPAGGSPNNVSYVLTSSGGPFCVTGLVLSPGLAAAGGPGQVGDVTASFARINGEGLSHPSVKLFDNGSGGSSPQDLILTYGNQICTGGSMEFDVTHWPASTGGGVDVHLFGSLVVLAADGVTVTVN